MHRFGGMGLAASLQSAWGPKTLEARMRDAERLADSLGAGRRCRKRPGRRRAAEAGGGARQAADQKGDGKLGLDDVTAGAMAGVSRALVFAR
jgi:hypothetical protein